MNLSAYRVIFALKYNNIVSAKTKTYNPETHRQQQEINKKSWEKEIQKRKDFGISDAIFWETHYIKTHFCSMKFIRDFQSLYLSYIHLTNHQHHSHDSETRKLLMSTFIKYKKYVFHQLKEAGGALHLSLVCPIVHVITKENIEYRGCKIEIFHRVKNTAQNPKAFPPAVTNVFKKHNSCRAVAFLYKISITKFVMVEKVHENYIKH